MTTEDPAQEQGPQLAPHHERRRSQRVVLRVSVTLHISIEGKPLVVSAFTADVNAHGALLLSPENFLPGARLILEHCQSHQRIGCRVTRNPQPAPDGFHVPVEFESAAPGFWHIVFPPTNWKSTGD